MKLFRLLFHRENASREDTITAVSWLGIAVNVLIAAVKVIVGALASSIAIISEGVNNATDAMTSVLTLVGTKLAGKRPDEKHPFGYGRVEYLTSLVVAVLILVTGTEMLISSVKLVFKPAELEISYLSIIIVAASAIIKFFLGVYTVRMGKKTESGALVGVGLECRNDAFVSVVTIASALIFLLFDLSVDAYAGIISSAIILKAGIEVLLGTISELLGRPGEKELATALYAEIRGTEGVLGAADMMLHNYGPEAYSGSVNVEMDQGRTVGEIYQILHALQLRIMHEHNVTMVFGVYAVDNAGQEAKALRACIGGYVSEKEHVKSFHAVYLEQETGKIYCDFIVDYKLRDWDGLRKDFEAFMAQQYPGHALELVIETEFV